MVEYVNDPFFLSPIEYTIPTEKIPPFVKLALSPAKQVNAVGLENLFIPVKNLPVPAFLTSRLLHHPLARLALPRERGQRADQRSGKGVQKRVNQVIADCRR